MLDVLVVGSGPAGLSAAIYAGRANLQVLVVEKAGYGTGQIAESSRVDNYPGFLGINGYELGTKFREHAESFGIQFKDGEAERFSFMEGIWRVRLKDGEEIEAGTVIYAAGAAHRHLDIPGENEFIGKGVSYCATCDGAFFRDRVTAVIGGGDTALDDALYLSDISSKVYLVHRRNEFRGSAKTVEKLREKANVEFVLGAEPAEIIGEDRVQKLVLKDGRALETEGVFIAAGMNPMTEAVKGIAELDVNGYLVADETGRTSAEGFFAAGDVRTKALRQVVTAVSDGANAAVSAEHYLQLAR
ncbi:MAG: FAD-dependent oxidoreductase [Bacteroidales bacterium]|nr:FAD-dependent oxidoreductase [Clostridium sp.]MCM1203622.1 FAD-dependent oxidoreductase [Bacteroidales bacterium]